MEHLPWAKADKTSVLYTSLQSLEITLPSHGIVSNVLRSLWCVYKTVTHIGKDLFKAEFINNYVEISLISISTQLKLFLMHRTFDPFRLLLRLSCISSWSVGVFDWDRMTTLPSPPVGWRHWAHRRESISVPAAPSCLHFQMVLEFTTNLNTDLNRNAVSESKC